MSASAAFAASDPRERFAWVGTHGYCRRFATLSFVEDASLAYASGYDCRSHYLKERDVNSIT